MTLRSLPIALGVLLLGAGCGSSPPPASPSSSEKPRTVTGSDEKVAASTEPEEPVPSRCVRRKGACMPPIRWAEKLCGDVYPDLALYMFREGTQWTRYYLRTGLNAVNGWGPTVDEDMVSREEVLVINHRITRGSFEVEGSEGTYDVFRWNGSCVTLDINEVTSRPPSRPMNSRIDWRALSEPMQDALLDDSEVEEMVQERRKACKGASIGRVTARCEELDKKLPGVIADYVRNTSELPAPQVYPE